MPFPQMAVPGLYAKHFVGILKVSHRCGLLSVLFAAILQVQGM